MSDGAVNREAQGENVNRMVVEAEGLRREFGSKGRSAPCVAVDDVSLSIAAGEILCLLGPNGAGKTTTVKMLATLLAPTAGAIRIDGVDAVANPREARSRLGLVLGGERGFYLRASARDNLLFFADVLGVPGGERKRRVEKSLEAVALTRRASDPVEAFSRGMRQRLHIARGLLNDPRVLLLDEPTNGLDPEIARDIRALVRDLASAGTAVLLTTHYLTEAEQLANSLALIVDGSITVTGDAAGIAARSGVSTITTLSLDDVLDSEIAHLQSIEGLGQISSEIRGGRTHLHLPWNTTPDDARVVSVLRSMRGSVPDDLLTRRATLEESYLALVGGGATT